MTPGNRYEFVHGAKSSGIYRQIRALGDKLLSDERSFFCYQIKKGVSNVHEKEL